MTTAPRTTRLLLTLATGLLAVAAPGADAASAGTTFLTSGVDLPAGTIASSGSGYDGEPAQSSVSADGRYVTFLSEDDGIAPGVELDVANVVRKDRITGEVVLVSRATGAAGAAARAKNTSPVISADGNRVAWATAAQLDPADTDSYEDVYVRDVSAGTTTLATPGITTGNVNDFDLSGDGDWLAFATTSGLTVGDVNAVSDVYRRNLTTGTTALASVISATLTSGNAASVQPAISDDGRWVAFASQATNLFGAYVDGGASYDVFAHDFTSTSTVLVSAKFDSSPTGGNGSSTRPRIAGTPTTLGTLRVGYASEATNLVDAAVTDPSAADSAYVRSMAAVPSTLISRATGFAGANANSRAHLGGISNDGQWAVFASDATNLGPGDHYYGAYLRNLITGTTTLLSAKNEYAVNPAIAGAGSFAAWLEYGATADIDPALPGVFGRALPAGAIELVSRTPGTERLTPAAPSVDYPNSGAHTISADGRYTTFAAVGAGLGSDLGHLVYRRDLQTNALELVSRANGPSGAPASGSARGATISSDGTRVAFETETALDPADTNMTTDVYVRDLVAQTTTLASRAAGQAGVVGTAASSASSISADGMHVAFRTASTNFGVADGKSHIYVRDLASFTTTLADRADGVAGTIGSQSADAPQLSADGRLVVFQTAANNLSPDDPAVSTDVYVRDLVAATTTLVSRRTGLTGQKVGGSAFNPAISSDGKVVAFETSDQLAATEAGPWGGTTQIVARTLDTGANALASRAPGGAPASKDARGPSLSGDGSVIAFSTKATNLLPGIGGANRDGVIVRDMASGELTGPPAFGLAIDGFQQRSEVPSVSDNGRCVAFVGRGHNAVTGAAGDEYGQYVYVRAGDCPPPAPGATTAPDASPGSSTTAKPAPALFAPRLTKVSVTNKRFKVGRGSTALTASAARAPKKTPTGTAFRFTLDSAATVRITIARRTIGRKAGTRCLKATKARAKRKRCTRYATVGTLIRTGLSAGAKRVTFSGRLGKRRLAVGTYRATVVASAIGGKSKAVRVSFKVVRR